jgi:ABC-type sulfate/molybdate transport systems ATPase subunit
MLEANLHKQLRDFPLDLNLRVNPGEILVLMGENGAGKSTVLNSISGLLKPDNGSITLNKTPFFDSANAINLPVEDRHIGYVLQNIAAFPHLSVAENIAYGMKVQHIQKDLIIQRVNHWMELMDVQELAGVRAGNLSGGQKQRVALARALAIEPGLLMLDEPFTALDASSMDSVKHMVKDFVAERRIPCIVVTHRVEDAHDMGDRICILSQGTNIWEGKSRDLPAVGNGSVSKYAE